MTKQPVVPDARTAQLLGIACILAGSFLLYDAYDARGRGRPYWVRFLPGA